MTYDPVTGRITGRPFLGAGYRQKVTDTSDRSEGSTAVAAPTGPHGAVVPLDVGSLAASTGTLAALARLRLAARRTGHGVRLRGASPELRALLEWAGLAGEFEWQAEEGVEPGGVEE